MPLIKVEMTRQEWDHICTLLATKCIWADVNQVMMKISFQVQEQVKANGKMAEEQPQARQ